MKKEDILQYVGSKNGKIIGYFQVPFPVYVVHVAYDSVDSDPFFPLYKAILRYTKSCPKMDKTPYFANLIGFEKELIDQCIKHLKEDGMIRLTMGDYKVTDDAERKYLTANSRPTVRVTGSFLVDGKNLKLLPEFIYQSDRRWSNWEVNVSAHMAIDLAMNAAPGKKVVQYLGNSNTLEMLHLETTGNNFEVLEFDKKFLCGAYAVFYLDEQNQYHKDIIYDGHLLTCDATGSAKTYTIELNNKGKSSDKWGFTPNLGYNISDSEKMASVAVFTQNDGWSKILSERYKTNNFVFQIETDEITKLPCIYINDSLIRTSSSPLDIIEDAARGYIDFPVKSNGVIRIKTKHEIQSYIDFIDTIKDWHREPDNNGKVIAYKLKQLFNNWRQLMVRFKLYEDLEKIDCDCFIFNK